MKITYHASFDFHNVGPITLVVSGKILPGLNGGEVYVISKGQASRVAKHFCEIGICKCPKGDVEILDMDRDYKPTEWGLSVNYCQE